MTRYLLLSVCVLVSFASLAQTISIQGVLRDAKGRTVADGDYQVTFSLYESLTGGSALYTELHPSITTSQGLFSALLGAEGAPDTLSALPFDTTYYIGISIEGKAELEPRTELTLNPYAASVRGGDNQLPSTGNVSILTDVTVDLGNVYLAAGDLLLEKGNVRIDSGTLTINLGDIQLTDAGGAIRFSDGTILNSAEGGTASSAGAADTLSITADADMDSTGGIEFQIGIQPAMVIRNDGFLTMEAGMMLDSGKLMYKGDRDITLGHYQPGDSSFLAQLTISADSTATFAKIPQSLDSAEADDDAFTLGYLKTFTNERLTQYVDQGLDIELGDTYQGGKVFAMEDGYAYIAYYHDGYMEVSYQDFYDYSSWNSSALFGSGYENTQRLFSQHNNETYTSVVEGFLLANDLAGYDDWFLPSREEVVRLLQVDPNFDQGYRIPTSTYHSGCSSSNVAYIEYIVNDNSIGCENIELTDNSSYRFIFVRRIENTSPFYDTSDPNDYVTAGVLQQNRSRFIDNSYKIGALVGVGNDQGTVFAQTEDSVYIAKYINSSYRQTYSTGFSWESSQDFGTGYTNTQAMIAASKAYNGSSLYSDEWGYQIETNHPNWYLPSVDELKAVLDSLPSGFAPGNTYLWTSSNYNTSTSYGYYVSTNGSGKYSSNDYTSRRDISRAILIRKVANEDLNFYSTNPSNLVTWAYYNARMDGLERKLTNAANAYLDRLRNTLPTYTVGQQTEGGTVFAIQDGYAYIAYEYDPDNSYRFENYATNATGTAIGTGYSNTQEILNNSSNTSNSYIEGILRSTVNGHNDWFLPSSGELQAVFNNTSVATNALSYYWSSTYYGCCEDYYIYNPNGASSFENYYDYRFLILVRRVPTN
ncbi:MAG: hypothetical protein JXR10_17225 [Cyclobacteriaceae bacterium]